MRQLREQRANTRPLLHVADPGTVTAGCPLGFNTEQGMQQFSPSVYKHKASFFKCKALGYKQ